MTALTANNEVQEKEGVKVNVPVVASDIIYKGALLKYNAAGYAAPCSTEAGAFFAGIAESEADNSAGSAGDLNVDIKQQGSFLLTGSGLGQSDVGSLVYASDDQTITTTDSGDLQLVGRIVNFVSATQVWVNILGSGHLSILGDAIESSEVVLAEGSMLVGNASGVGAALDGSAGGNILVGNDTTMVALDGSGDTQILIGNATTMTSAALSGDVTMDNAGAVTIAAAAVEESMIKGSTADEKNLKRIWRGDYTFSATTAGSYNIGTTLPDNAIIEKAWVDVIVTCAGDGDDSSTIAITSGESANDIVTAVAIQTGTPWDAGLQAGIPVGTVATMIKSTGAIQPQVVVAINSTDTNIATGQLVVFIQYVVSE